MVVTSPHAKWEHRDGHGFSVCVHVADDPIPVWGHGVTLDEAWQNMLDALHKTAGRRAVQATKAVALSHAYYRKLCALSLRGSV